MTDEEIERFMQTLPKREKGGPATEGMYMTHGTKQKPEWVINADAVRAYGANFMASLNNLEVPKLDSPVMRELTGRAMEQNNNQNIVINVTVANDIDVSGDSSGVQSLASRMEEELYNAINKGIQSRRINLLSGGRV